MLNLIREFRFGRPQQFAALLLLALIVLLAAQGTKPGSARSGETLDRHESWDLAISTSLLYGNGTFTALAPAGNLPRCLWCDSIIETRVNELQILAFEHLHLRSTWPSESAFVRWCRIPFATFCVWLAAALWWVTRRLYNDRGAYVALALFCFSLPMISAGSRVNADILAAWGLFGFLYTAVGVAHTLHAPPRKWRPRILLLGVALGVTASAHFAAGLIGLVLAGGFMLYLAPGRRAASLAILASAAAIAAAILWALYGFRASALLHAIGAWKQWGFTVGVPPGSSFAHWMSAAVFSPQTFVLGALFAVGLVAFLLWRWTRYFGNFAPLLAVATLAFLRAGGSHVMIWGLPFVFTFIGGMFADLMESRKPELVKALFWVAMGAYATLAVLSILIPAAPGPASL